jgi:hypothetical protein
MFIPYSSARKIRQQLVGQASQSGLDIGLIEAQVQGHVIDADLLQGFQIGPQCLDPGAKTLVDGLGRALVVDLSGKPSWQFDQGAIRLVYLRFTPKKGYPRRADGA